jgi:hypothetical protein
LTLVGVVGGAAAICACSVLVGQAVWRTAGFRGWSWLAGPVGLATLLCVARTTVSLPGRDVTAAVAIGIVTLTAFVLRPRGGERGAVRETAAVLVLGLAAAALPFAAAGRVGTLGVTDNADLAGHLLLADSIGSGHPAVGLDPAWYANYPTGPHAFVAALGTGLRLPLDAGFAALLLATLALTASAALHALRDCTRPRRIVGALVAGFPYLGVAYTVQSSFKETLLGAMVVGWTLAVPIAARAAATRAWALLPLLLIAAGTFTSYSFVGLIWLAGIAVVYGLALAVHARRLPPVGAWVRSAATTRHALAAAVFAVVTAIVVVPEFDRARALGGAFKDIAHGGSTGGNIRAELPAYEIAGIWPRSDLRVVGAGMSLARVLALAGVCAAAWAAWWCWRRRRLELPAAAAAASAIYLASRATATPYYSGKGLAIAAFAVSLMTVTAVVSALPSFGPRMGRRRALAGGAGVAFLALAAWSSGLALRGARVAPAQHQDELLSLRPLLERGPTLYTAQNDYAAWILRGVKLAFPYAYIGRSQVEFEVRAEKRWTIAGPFDFDSVDPGSIDHFRFVLSPRSAYVSQPPRNWRELAGTRSYRVWERRGPTAPRAVAAEAGGPGAPLDCAAARIAATSQGMAGVRPRPVLIPLWTLRDPAGRRLGRGEFGFAAIAPGGDALARVTLARGRWDLSLQYVSGVGLEASVESAAGPVAGSGRLATPPSLEGPGAFWSMGTIATRGGPLRLRIHARSDPALSTFDTVLLGSLALTPTPVHDRQVPLQQACGRYVDWYRAG